MVYLPAGSHPSQY